MPDIAFKKLVEPQRGDSTSHPEFPGIFRRPWSGVNQKD